MSGPSIEQSDAVIGFFWRESEGLPTTLTALVASPGAEPVRWLATHLEALDDVLIAMADRFGQVLGGGRDATTAERTELADAFRSVDQACLDYRRASRAARAPVEQRAGQIIGTATLFSVRARTALGLIGPAPLEDVLDRPDVGVVSGHARLDWVDADQPWRGARWVVHTEDGRRLPATLSMLLHDSSGVLTDAARDEHRAALRRVCASAGLAATEPISASGAIDWLLYDFLMAHRDGPESAAVHLRPDRLDDAQLVLSASAASIEIRERFDTHLVA